MPARASTGAASLRMRPLGSARISFSFSTFRLLGVSDRMSGFPGRRPRLADVPEMACETGDFQTDGPLRREAQDHRTVIFQAGRQEIEHAVGLVERDLVVMDLLHLVEDQRRMGAPVLRLDGGVAFPTEAV